VSFRPSARACLAAGFVCLQAADLVCTYLLLDGGHRADVYEANPLARSVLLAGGWPGVALFKLSSTAVAVLAALLLSRRRPAAALRLLGLLCAVMLGVNGYSAWLLASPGASAVAQRRESELADRLERRMADTREYHGLRDGICDAVLDGGCDRAEASRQLAGLIAEYGPKVRLPGVARLPEPSRPGELEAYLSFHLSGRAVKRGMTGRLAELGSPAPKPKARGHDPSAPPWLRCMN
jgi:hypothetical protein